MKFVELKKDLEKQIKPAYLISGNDRFLCYSALELIKKSVNISMKELNEVVLSGDNLTFEQISETASIFPFIDQYRLIQINGFNLKSKEKNNALIQYLNNPLTSSVIIFFNLEGCENIKVLSNKIEFVDCDKIDNKMIARIIKNKAAQIKVDIEDQAIELLILYCNADMARITSEFEKLVCYVGDNAITEQDIKDLVVQDKEYQIFELAEFIAKGEKEKALDLVYTLSNDGKSAFTLLTPLYNNYKRALFVSINKDKTETELANLLGVKEYAIRMTKNQIKVFTPKKLKQIVDLLYEADRNIKTGKMNDQVAIKTTVLNILKIRG